MKKALALILAAILMISLMGCGSNSNNNEGSSSQAFSESTTTRSQAEKPENTSVPEKTTEGTKTTQESDNKGSSSSQASSEATTSQLQTKKAESTSVPEQTTVEPKTTQKAVEPVNLVGLWVQENGDKNTYMAATIREDGKIGVFFILEGDDTPWTYWVGTYEVPTDGKEEFSWVSKSTYDGNGLMASSDDTKEFTYKDGKITYPITIQGKSGYLSLVPGEWNTSNIPESVFTAEKQKRPISRMLKSQIRVGI